MDTRAADNHGNLEPTAADTLMRILAPNPSPMTLDGTNTWILHQPGTPDALVVDPGPMIESHLEVIEQTLNERGAHQVRIVLTHGHHDHCENARELASRLASPIYALDPNLSHGTEGLADGAILEFGDHYAEVLTTAGHTQDSICLSLPDFHAVLTGDTVLGRGTSVVAHPDGKLGAYFTSLERLRRLAEQGISRVLPGHGPELEDLERVIRAYQDHRQARLSLVQAALDQGLSDEENILDTVYPDLDPLLKPAARLSLRAQLDYLRSL